MSHKIGVVDVGGGFRGIYAAGVFDYCLDNNITFDLCIGVSAGSANIASYMANQPRRNYQFHTEFGMRKEYASVQNFLKKRNFIDLDYVYGTLSNSDGESPLDYQAIMRHPADMYVVATDAETGKAKYFTKADLAYNHYDIFKASSAIPFVCKPYQINQRAYYDGALSDPVPIEKAFLLGCDKVVVLLTLPVDHIRTAERDNFLASRIRKQYPIAAAELQRRAMRYNSSIVLAKHYAKQGKVLIISPDDTCGVSTLSRKPEALKKLYQKGYIDGERIKHFFEQ